MTSERIFRQEEMRRRLRVLIVDDSVVMRRVISLALESDPLLEVVGTARNGKEAIERLQTLAPDAITMDIEMPEMDGLEAVRQLRKLSSSVRIVMLSTLTQRGASVTLEALSLGADDYVAKQQLGSSADESLARLRQELVPKIRQFFPSLQAAESELLATGKDSVGANKAAPSSQISFAAKTAPRVVAFGVSTGGPAALSQVLPELPKEFPCPVLIVQHMPRLFTKLLCERLQAKSSLCVREATHGEPLRPGVILLAPGDYHMRVEMPSGQTEPRIALDQKPPENSCRPAVDPLFESLARVYGAATIAAVLTGMGHDGLRGARLLKRRGAMILAQNEATSAVWGMPRAIAEADLADRILPLDGIMPEILRRCQTTAVQRRFPLPETLHA